MEDLAHPAHQRDAKPMLQQIDPREYGLDVIVFIVRALPEGMAWLLTAFDEER